MHSNVLFMLSRPYDSFKPGSYYDGSIFCERNLVDAGYNTHLYMPPKKVAKPEQQSYSNPRPAYYPTPYKPRKPLPYLESQKEAYPEYIPPQPKTMPPKKPWYKIGTVTPGGIPLIWTIQAQHQIPRATYALPDASTSPAGVSTFTPGIPTIKAGVSCSTPSGALTSLQPSPGSNGNAARASIHTIQGASHIRASRE